MRSKLAAVTVFSRFLPETRHCVNCVEVLAYAYIKD